MSNVNYSEICNNFNTDVGTAFVNAGTSMNNYYFPSSSPQGIGGQINEILIKPFNQSFGYNSSTTVFFAEGSLSSSDFNQGIFENFWLGNQTTINTQTSLDNISNFLRKLPFSTRPNGATPEDTYRARVLFLQFLGVSRSLVGIMLCKCYAVQALPYGFLYRLFRVRGVVPAIERVNMQVHLEAHQPSEPRFFLDPSYSS